ncbi:MAG: tetratricopeptide repeat protein [Planctomycetes bacterium]|nr:tetratricopeptide repeat protein [Planctomycetota bacterium]
MLRCPLISSLAIVLCCGPIGWAHNDLEERIEAATEAIDREPGNPTGYLERGDLYRQHQQWAEALSDFEHARGLAPDLPIVDLDRGMTFADAGRHLDAVAAFDAFLFRAPDEARGLAGRARSQRALGRLPEAALDYAALERVVVEPDPQMYLDWCACAADDQSRLAVIARGLARLGSVASLEDMAVRLETATGRTDAALARIDRLIAASARPEGWWLRRGELLQACHRDDEARTAFAAGMAALELVPSHRRATDASLAIARGLQAGLEATPLERKP